MTATIVLLNGIGSTGKSSITMALQEIAVEPVVSLSNWLGPR